MAGNPVIAAWVAGGLIWGAALVGLGAMGQPDAFDHIESVTHQSSWFGTNDMSDARERALDGDPWGDEDALYHGVYRTAGAPDS